MRVGLLVYEGVDLLDAGGPYEVFLTASRLVARDGDGHGDPVPFEVVTISRTGSPVTAYGGLGLVPQAGVDDCGPLDVVVVPGTVDVDAATGNSDLVDAVRRLAASSDLTASVCTGAFLLAAADLVGDRPWTTHWEDVDALAARLGSGSGSGGGSGGGGVRGVRWVDAGDVVTAAGLSSGIAMALHLVDRLAGRALAERTARQIDYPWRPDGSADPPAG